MFNIVLVEPQIPPNTGNIIRLAANTGCKLHLIEPLGFSMEDKMMRRAGLDYHEYANVARYEDFNDFLVRINADKNKLFALTTKGKKNVYSQNFSPDDYLIFGAETHGLPQHIREYIDINNHLCLPMRENQRSLNLSNTVAAVVYEAWRQNDFR